MNRDISGKYLSADVMESLESFLIENGSLLTNGRPNITSVYINDGFYKTEFSEPNKAELGYLEIPKHWVESFIRDKKINSILGVNNLNN